jgi:hypothetical protein
MIVGGKGVGDEQSRQSSEREFGDGQGAGRLGSNSTTSARTPAFS